MSNCSHWLRYFFSLKRQSPISHQELFTLSLFKTAMLDRISIGASLVCAIHCAVLPIFLALFPVLSFLPNDNHAFHEALILLIVPMSSLAAVFGCRKHKDKAVLYGIVSGLVLLVGTAYFAHDFVGESGEKILTVLATFILAYSHWRNYSLCRQQTCCGDDSHGIER